jgi:hypothetical protein
MGNGLNEKGSKIGKLTGTICSKNGIELEMATMEDVVYLPTGRFNLFSLTKMTLKGWIFGGDEKRFGSKREAIVCDSTLLFRRQKESCLRCTFVAGAATDGAPSIPIQQAHDRLGHPGEDMTRMMAKELGWKLSPENLKPGDACAAGKAKQKNLPR